MIKGSVKIPIIRSGSKLITAISSNHKEPLIVSNTPLIETQVSELDKDYYPAYPPNLTEKDFSDSIVSMVILAKLLNKSVSDSGLSSDLLTKALSKNIVEVAAANYYLSLNLSAAHLDLLQTSDSAVLTVVFDRIFNEAAPSSDSFYNSFGKSLIDNSNPIDLGISKIDVSKNLEDTQMVEDDLVGEVGAGDDLVMLTSKVFSFVETVFDDFQTISEFYRDFLDNQSSKTSTYFDLLKETSDQAYNLEDFKYEFSSLKEDSVNVSYDVALSFSTQFSDSLTHSDTLELDFNKALEDTAYNSDVYLELNYDKALSEITPALEDFSRIVNSQREFEEISAAAYKVSLNTSLGAFVEGEVSVEASELNYTKVVSDSQDLSTNLLLHNFKNIDEVTISQDFTIITLVLLRDFLDNQLYNDSILINSSKSFSDNQSAYQEALTAHKQDYTSWDYFSEAYTGTITSL